MKGDDDLLLVYGRAVPRAALDGLHEWAHEHLPELSRS
jgi:hypothetical protein